MSEARIPFETAPGGRDALRGLERYIEESGLPPALVELVKLRVSTINHCAYCIDMHWRKLRDLGESEYRLAGLAAWREQSGYSAKERAALAWAESVTAVAQTGVPDADYAAISAHFSKKEIIDLTYVLAAINAWNRLCVALRIPPAHPLTEPNDAAR
ncbi:MAG TPA: carboxymuconolactone decarboxylase family protein [Polyangiaceae bacterium]|jgi:AhpD family alkylhydroperoxidase|nr:carboxymuconolactone decarboxylase family protein [Polyangiaceae bacterium]